MQRILFTIQMQIQIHTIKNFEARNDQVVFNPLQRFKMFTDITSLIG